MLQIVPLASPDYFNLPSGGGLFDSFIPLLLVVAVVLGILGVLFFLRNIAHEVHRHTQSFKRNLYMVRVPKEKKSEQEMQATERMEQIREEISIAEGFYTAIGGLKAQRGLMAWWHGRDDHVSFEIVVQKSLISFYVSSPAHMDDYVQRQIHAQYPHAQLDKIQDYNLFLPKSSVVAARLKFKRDSALPIKTYKKADSDPLNTITNSLSKLGEYDSVAIQFIVRSAKRAWRKEGAHISREIQQGKKFEDVVDKNRILMAAGKVTHGILKQFESKKQGMGPEPKEQYRLSPLEEELVKGVEEKISKAGLDANINIIVASETPQGAKLYLDNVVNAFTQFNLYHYGNSFFAIVPSHPQKLIRDYLYRAFSEHHEFVINTEEAASLYHLPLPSTETPGINWLGARKAPPPVNLPKEGVILGLAEYRGEEYTVRIMREDRRRHVYIIGKSGSGKTVLIQNMALQDIRNGDGVCVLDPNGDLIEYILEHMPPERAEDLIVFSPSDLEMPLGLNMLEAQTEDQKDFAVQEMISVFYKLFPPEMIGPMFEHQMRNVMLTLMADINNPGTIAEIPRMFSDEEFAATWVAKVHDPVVRAFWEKEMAKTSDFHKSEMLGYLISKVGRFVENEMMRNIIGQKRSSFDFREVMDNKKILLVNLAKGTTGEVNAQLLGLIIVAKLQMAAFSRAELPEEQRHDFYLYIDEFQNYTTDSIATILSEARKYRLCLTVAHQYMGQLVDKGDSKIKDAVLGNVGTMCTFRIGPEDAEILQKEYAPVFSAYDLLNVEQFTAYTKLLINNTATKPFNLRPFPPTKGNPELSKNLKELSRLKYGRPRAEVDAEIMERTQLGVASKNADFTATEATR